MGRPKKVVVEEASEEAVMPEKEMMAGLDLHFTREDLVKMEAKVNEIVDHLNK